mmetsp:Transcript_29058/g.59549  ORF Transcript_29058/g.59549 Transcript_29058/m.59549 type:complete len:211 (+) Transcript_29058:220-852(+)
MFQLSVMTPGSFCTTAFFAPPGAALSLFPYPQALPCPSLTTVLKKLLKSDVQFGEALSAGFFETASPLSLTNGCMTSSAKAIDLSASWRASSNSLARSWNSCLSDGLSCSNTFCTFSPWLKDAWRLNLTSAASALTTCLTASSRTLPSSEGLLEERSSKRRLFSSSIFCCLSWRLAGIACWASFCWTLSIMESSCILEGWTAPTRQPAWH